MLNLMVPASHERCRTPTPTDVARGSRLLCEEVEMRIVHDGRYVYVVGVNDAPM